MPDESYFDAADLLGEVFVETDQTVGHTKVVSFMKEEVLYCISYSSWK